MGRAIISFVHKNAQKSIFTLDENKSSLIVGRSKGCDLQIDDESVSARHGWFYLESGAVYYTDLNSTNGSFSYGRRLSFAGTALSDGAVVTLAGANSGIKLKVTMQTKE